MKTFILIGILLVVSLVGTAQPYIISSGTWNNTTVADPLSGYNETRVNGTRVRNSLVRYEHNTPLFSVADKNWLIRFNTDFLAATGTNSDYFLYQGANEIRGEGGTIVFDTLYLNNGAGNTFYINNQNNGFYFATETYFNPPGAISVYSRLYFNNGITSTNRQYPLSGSIGFVNSANYEGGLTDQQHVNGFVSESNFPIAGQQQGHGGDFTFPVGNASSVYQLRRQGVFGDFDHTISVGWVDGDPDATSDPTGGLNRTTSAFLGAGINSVVTTGFWDWHVQSMDELAFTPRSLPDPQTITVSIPDLTAISGITTADLRLVGFNTATSKWEDLSGAPNASGLTKGSTVTGVIPAGATITALAVGSTATIILPVDFISFIAKGDGCKVNLQWQTGMEQNNSHFIVERSNNGIQFNTIARVEAVGNSNTVQTYKFTDEAPVSGSTNYYRITQVDFDGKRTSSDVRSVRIQCDGSAVALRAYPNPVTSQVNVQTGKAVTQINLLSTNGQSVLKYAPSRNTGGTFSINMHAVQSGIYLLQLINKDGTTDVIKLVKQ